MEGIKRQVKKRGQTTIEYVLIFIIVIGGLIAMSVYFKRAMQGRWRAALDDLGEQYDPRFANTDLRHKLYTHSVTKIRAINADGGWYTSRTDEVVSNEIKTGYRSVGAY